ncbi:MAG: UDP-N-acetylglucosamine 2-epimerase [Verrucomicrobiota bacterium]
MRTIGIVTVARSDYGIYRPILREICSRRRLKAWLFVGGAHLSREFGLTVREIEKDGHKIRERIHFNRGSDRPRDIARSLGTGLEGFARAFARSRPDILVVLGDRFDMFAAAAAALPLKIPVAHIHGGELTLGAIDDALRHCITKLSHLHFPATDEYARRIIQMGEEPWRVTVSGAPGLDNLRSIRLPSKAEIERTYGIDLSEPSLVVTFHPVTLEYERTEWQTRELLAALEKSGRPVVFTLPSADTNSRVIIRLIRQYVRRRAKASLVENFGTRDYFGLMSVAAAMVGNSSSGLIEAPSFRLPVVNVGTRQAGRIRAANVIDVGYGRRSIEAGIRQAVSNEFRRGLRGLENPYGDGHAAERIIARLKDVPLDARLVTKQFHDVPTA